MAWSRVQSKTGNSGAVGVLTFNTVFDAAPTAGNIIVVSAAVFGTSSVPGPGAASLACTNVVWMFNAPLAQPGSQLNTILAVGRVFASPSDTVTLTWVGTGGAALAMAEYSFTDDFTFDKAASATGSSATAASGATATTEAGNQLFVYAIGSRGTNGVTFSAQTLGSIVGQDHSTINTSADRSVMLGESITSTPGTPNGGATISGSNIWVAQILTLREITNSSGGGGLRLAGHGGLAA